MTTRFSCATMAPLMDAASSLSARDGTRLFFQWHPPASARRGVVVLTHGLGEHSGRYGHVVEHLTKRGYAVARHDLRGHGHSGGRRGDARAFTAFLDDLDLVAAEAARCAGGETPLFFYGHSLGGLISLRFLQTRALEARGAVISSPWLRLAFEPPWWKLALGRMARRLLPGLRQPTGAQPQRVSHDAAFLQTLPDLHLVHHFISARLYFEVLAACAAAEAEAGAFTAPLLMLHGDADPVTSWQATRTFFDTAASPTKRLHLYPSVLHEVHNDNGRAQVLTDLTTWLDEQTAAS